MDFNEYQKAARSTAVYPGMGNMGYYPVLGLCGEAGEVAEKFKKILRNDGGVMSPEARKAIIRELGDIQWYLANIAEDLGTTLEEIAEENIAKLQDRKARNVIKSEGDNR